MKKTMLIAVIPFLLSSCYFGDRLQPIRALARSDKLEKKTEASILYQEAIQTLIEAYSSSAGLNKDIGTRLMNLGNYEKAIQHLKTAASIKNNDKVIYHNLAICYINLYKINKSPDYLAAAEENYTIALNLAPDSKGILYDYAQLLVFGTENYGKAVEILNHYLVDLGTPDKDGYFLLGRSYYMLGDFSNALKAYNTIYQFENKLSDEEKEKLIEFIDVCSKAGQK